VIIKCAINHKAEAKKSMSSNVGKYFESHFEDCRDHKLAWEKENSPELGITAATAYSSSTLLDKVFGKELGNRGSASTNTLQFLIYELSNDGGLPLRTSDNKKSI
jgi:hypothetical protein